jgi:hypothetical protein
MTRTFGIRRRGVDSTGMQRISALLLALVLSLAAVASTPVTGLASAQAPASLKRDLPSSSVVMVSVDVPAGRRPATLVRFPRNRIALLRLANGRLALKARGRYRLTSTRANRSVRVRLKVDCVASQITARARTRRVRVELRLSAEAHVAVSRTGGWCGAGAGAGARARSGAGAVVRARQRVE